MTPWEPPHEPWEPCTAPVTSGTSHRSARVLSQVVEQFHVETSPRYQPTKEGQTYCNIFAWDVTRAMACEVPHWWKGKELTANATLPWLEKTGPSHGWTEVDELIARANAEAGKPTLALWVNPTGGPGHIAVLVPAMFASETEIAQAGKKNFARGSLSSGFGSRPVKFYAHA